MDVTHQMAYEGGLATRPLCEIDDDSQPAWLGTDEGVTCEECLRRFRTVDVG